MADPVGHRGDLVPRRRTAPWPHRRRQQTATSKYIADPSVLPATFYPGGQSSDIWKAGTLYDWQPIPDGNGVGFITAPLADDIVDGRRRFGRPVDQQSTSADTDLEVTISEVRPDGQEIYVQSGWLRASQRKLADDAHGAAIRCTPTSKPTPQTFPRASSRRCAGRAVPVRPPVPRRQQAAVHDRRTRQQPAGVGVPHDRQRRDGHDRRTVAHISSKLVLPVVSRRRRSGASSARMRFAPRRTVPHMGRAGSNGG